MTEETISLYDAIGGDACVRKLVAEFYRVMDTNPEARHCRAVHPPSLVGSEQKLYEYMTGYLGGPPLYIEKYGHPRLRSRHFPAAIGRREVNEWLLCFRLAMDSAIEHPKLREIIWAPIEKLAFHMQNKDEETSL